MKAIFAAGEKFAMLRGLSSSAIPIAKILTFEATYLVCTYHSNMEQGKHVVPSQPDLCLANVKQSFTFVTDIVSGIEKAWIEGEKKGLEIGRPEGK